MKTVAIHLRLETASHRNRMLGIFRQLGADKSWDIRIVQNENDFCGMLAPNVDHPLGGIISGIPYSDRVKQAIVASGAHFVGIGMSKKEISTAPGKSGFVLNDNKGIGRTAAKHFLNLGNFRSYAFVPDLRGRPWSHQRGNAFAAALRREGKLCETFRSEGNDAKDLKHFLARLAKPAAVLAAWDGRAADVIHAAREANLKVPEDMSVLGVDDDKLVCEHTLPTLSSIKTDAEGMGEAAAKMLVSLVSGKPEGRTRIRSVRCPILGIVERESTRAPAPATDLIQRARAFIESEYANDIGPDEVARYLKVSRRLLDLRFRQYESKSVTAAITDRRLEHAKALLSDSSIPIKEVFVQAGFGNVSHATKIFREKLGLSPKEWRRIYGRKGRRAASGALAERLADLTESDAEDLRLLSLQLAPDAQFDATAVRRSVRRGNTAIFVICRKSRIVASASAGFFSTPTGSHCRIEDVVVDVRSRGKGLGRCIMADVLAALKEMGVASVELTSRPSRVAANALYQALGFTRRETNVYEYRF